MYKFPLFSFNLGFLLNLRFFLSPYFDHDAFMHHALHVLDAPVQVHADNYLNSFAGMAQYFFNFLPLFNRHSLKINELIMLILQLIQDTCGTEH